jgi:hypothetical protein
MTENRPIDQEPWDVVEARIWAETRDRIMAAVVRRRDREREEEVDRIEVIDETGWAYVRTPVSIRLDFQDDGRTLTVFVTPKEPGDG